MDFKLLSIVILFSAFSFYASAQDYKNPKIPIDQRVNDLLRSMTIEEKVAQLQSFHMARPILTDEVLGSRDKMDSMFGKGVGMMNPDFDATAEQTVARRNALQNYLKTQT